MGGLPHPLRRPCNHHAACNSCAWRVIDVERAREQRQLLAAPRASYTLASGLMSLSYCNH